MISPKCLLIAGIVLLGASVLLQSCGDSPGTGNSGTGGSSTGTGGSSNGNGGSTIGTGGSPSGSGGSTVGTGGSLSGSGGSNTGTGGSLSGSGGSNTGTGGSLSGSGGATTGTGGSGSCPARTAATMAVHQILDVTWPSTLGASGGTGKFHIWQLAKLATSGTTLSGADQPCGTIVPETTLAAIIGGGKLLIEVPSAFWDAQPPLQFSLAGTQSGWAPNSTVKWTAQPALVGLTMTDPSAAWPSSYTSITAADVDKDGKPGLTSIPKSGAGYVNPPVSIGGPKADQVDVATRTEVDMDGTFTSCTDQSGTATTKYLDNHVVGCHVAGGGECTAAQVKFLDDNRTAFTVTGGTYVAKIVPDTATCADVRAALPN